MTSSSLTSTELTASTDIARYNKSASHFLGLKRRELVLNICSALEKPLLIPHSIETSFLL